MRTSLCLAVLFGVVFATINLFDEEVVQAYPRGQQLPPVVHSATEDGGQTVWPVFPDPTGLSNWPGVDNGRLTWNEEVGCYEGIITEPGEPYDSIRYVNVFFYPMWTWIEHSYDVDPETGEESNQGTKTGSCWQSNPGPV